jgi:hypothetical protein
MREAIDTISIRNKDEIKRRGSFPPKDYLDKLTQPWENYLEQREEFVAQALQDIDEIALGSLTSSQ